MNALSKTPILRLNLVDAMREPGNPVALLPLLRDFRANLFYYAGEVAAYCAAWGGQDVFVDVLPAGNQQFVRQRGRRGQGTNL
jgi:hypothetical protein